MEVNKELKKLNESLLKSYEESYEFISGEIMPMSFEEKKIKSKEVKFHRRKEKLMQRMRISDYFFFIVYILFLYNLF